MATKTLLHLLSQRKKPTSPKFQDDGFKSPRLKGAGSRFPLNLPVFLKAITSQTRFRLGCRHLPLPSPQPAPGGAIPQGETHVGRGGEPGAARTERPRGTALYRSSGPAGPRAGIAGPAHRPSAARPGLAAAPRAPAERSGRRGRGRLASSQARLSRRRGRTGLGPGGPPRPRFTPPGRLTLRARSARPACYLTSLGSRPVSLRIFSSTFLRLSLAFSSCSCKVLTATAIFSPQQASRLLHRPRRGCAAPRDARDGQPDSANDERRCFSVLTTQRLEGGDTARLCSSGPMGNQPGGRPLPTELRMAGSRFSAKAGRVRDLGLQGRACRAAW